MCTLGILGMHIFYFFNTDRTDMGMTTCFKDKMKVIVQNI